LQRIKRGYQDGDIKVTLMVRHEQIGFARINPLSAVYAYFHSAYPEHSSGPEADESDGPFAVTVKVGEENDKNAPKKRKYSDNKETKGKDNPAQMIP
jgi:hypothetical protein